MLIRNLAFTALFAVGVAGLSSSAQAASVTGSANCPSGVCATFDNDDTIPVIKTFQFSMPSAGFALVQFSGSLYCSSDIVADKVIDVISAITTAPSQVPAIANVSALRHAHVLKDATDHAFDSSTSFNLQSVRIVNYTSAGIQTVYFRIARARQDLGVNCVVYGGQFIVTRFP